MISYTCPNCKITTNTESSLIKEDLEAMKKNIERVEINKKIDEENYKTMEAFEKEMENVKKFCGSKEKLKDMRIFLGNKNGYEILKISNFETEKSFYPELKSHALLLPTMFVECPECKHRQYIK